MQPSVTAGSLANIFTQGGAPAIWRATVRHPADPGEARAPDGDGSGNTALHMPLDRATGIAFATPLAQPFPAGLVEAGDASAPDLWPPRPPQSDLAVQGKASWPPGAQDGAMRLHLDMAPALALAAEMPMLWPQPSDLASEGVDGASLPGRTSRADRSGWAGFTSDLFDFGRTAEPAHSGQHAADLSGREADHGEGPPMVRSMAQPDESGDDGWSWMGKPATEAASGRVPSWLDFARVILGPAEGWPEAGGTLDLPSSRFEAVLLTRLDIVQAVANGHMQLHDSRTEALFGYQLPRGHLKEIGALYPSGMRFLPDGGDAWSWI